MTSTSIGIGNEDKFALDSITGKAFLPEKSEMDYPEGATPKRGLFGDLENASTFRGLFGVTRR